MIYTKELLEPIVAESLSVAEVLRKLGQREIGSIHTHLTKRIKDFQLDTSHFKGVKCGPRTARPKKHWTEILILRCDGKREKTFRLRRALLESGRVHECDECHVGPSWNDKPLTLQIEHKNTNIDDDRPENLIFLCPNCHSQTPTYSKCRTKGRGCSCCGKRLKNGSNKSGVCWSCGRGKSSNADVL